MTQQAPAPEPTPMAVVRGASRWQKVVGSIGLVVVLLAGTQMADIATSDGSGDMDHGPGGGTPPAEVPEDGDETPPEGGDHTPPSGTDH